MSFKNTVAGHQNPSIHCICCNIKEPTANPSILSCSGTLISIEIAVPRLACKEIDLGISLINISVRLWDSRLIKIICTQSNLSDIPNCVPVETTVIPPVSLISKIESIYKLVDSPGLSPCIVINKS